MPAFTLINTSVGEDPTDVILGGDDDVVVADLADPDEVISGSQLAWLLENSDVQEFFSLCGFSAENEGECMYVASGGWATRESWPSLIVDIPIS